MSLAFVTSNEMKFASLARILISRGIEVRQVALELPEPQIADLQIVAEHKARYAYNEMKIPLIVQDSGFFLAAWPGFPGAFTKHAVRTLGAEGVLKLVAGSSRTCEFREHIAYYDGIHLKSFEMALSGQVAMEAEGDLPENSPNTLWKIFIPEGCTKTLAAMSRRERDDWRNTRSKVCGDIFADWYCNENRSQ